MKKFLLVLMVAALAIAVASPAMAIKLTSSGRMDVAGIYVSNNIVDSVFGFVPGLDDDMDNQDAWYQMELVIDPVLHINDNVRIHGRITVLERVMDGADLFNNNLGADYRGASDWWVERLYLSFPLFGGTMYAGRMSGGGWAYPFQDNDDNRDRIKYVRKFGNIVVAALVEKLQDFNHGLGTVQRPLTIFPGPFNQYDTSADDTNSYAVGSVIPFSKNIVYKPLLYYVDFQDLDNFITGGAGAFPRASGYDLLWMNGLMVKFGGFKLDTEINMRKRAWDDVVDWDGDGSLDEVEGTQWSGWLDAGYTFGPVEVALGAFYVEGDDNDIIDDGVDWDTDDIGGFWGVGFEFDPYFLLFSEDVGLLANTAGVANDMGDFVGAPFQGASGYESIYLRGAFQLTENMKLSAILGYLQANEMHLQTWDNRNFDDEIGWEADVRFEWNFMDNIAYVVDAGYLHAGDYFSDYTELWSNAVYGDETLIEDRNVWGMRHMLVINW